MKKLSSFFLMLGLLMSPMLAFAQLNKFEKTYKLIQFDKLDIKGNYQVFITNGTEYSVRIVNDSAINAKEASVVISEKKGKLSIDYKGNSAESKGMNIHINMPTITDLRLAEEVKMNIDDLKIGDIKIQMRDKSKLSGMLVAQDIGLVMRNSAKVDIKGAAASLKLRVRDEAAFLGENFKVRSIDVKQQGTANLGLNASGSLKISAKGVGEIRYTGSPNNLNMNKKGTVNIKQVD
jgi:hypothetical protein